MVAIHEIESDILVVPDIDGFIKICLHYFFQFVDEFVKDNKAEIYNYYLIKMNI